MSSDRTVAATGITLGGTLALSGGAVTLTGPVVLASDTVVETVADYAGGGNVVRSDRGGDRHNARRHPGAFGRRGHPDRACRAGERYGGRDGCRLRGRRECRQIGPWRRPA